ncbi:NADH:ubiquinone oxidoreductase subunit NDUFA12 [Cucumibacter marinus]|jgi:NADH:ubiquinone oxidoreductase subunit|uniref:NADH:ubiquinone oxidoreductase subunit NDUFA12 n=1 Tax=Cucumibacter marinus TaxID=1121252 RepID=UPI000404F6E3|nr:NADH:ubiquinone oxidoreductase subunit NDUFA12 [Cucumibacter marinus]
MKQLLAEIFIWWHKQTLGTRIWTAVRGTYVGEDEQGNKYYREKGTDRRWVIYNGAADASRIPPGWHGWIHHRVDTPPTEEEYTPHEWQAAHVPNMTGTAAAYRPKGSLLRDGERPRVTGDYDAWSPE